MIVAALLATFVTIERRSAAAARAARHPALGPLVRANLGAAALFGSYFGFQFVGTLYLQTMNGWSAIETALAFLPAGLLVAFGAPRLGPLVDRFGTARIIAAGGVVAGRRLRCCSCGSDDNPSYLGLMLPTMLLLGTGFALKFPSLNIQATAGVADHEQGLASGLLNTSFQVGGAVGLAIVSAVVSWSGAAAMLDGFRPAIAVSDRVAAHRPASSRRGVRSPPARGPRSRGGKRLAPGGGEHPAPVAGGDLVDLVALEARGLEGGEDARVGARVGTLGGHRRAVEVRPERDVVDAAAVGHVAGVLGDPRQRRVGVVAAVRAQRADVEVDPDEPAARRDRVELVVREVAASTCTARARPSARRSAGRRASRTSQNPASLRWLRSTAMPSSAQRSHERAPASVRPGPVSGERRELERHAVRERVGAAPDDADRAQAGRVPDSSASRPVSIASAPSKWKTTPSASPARQASRSATSRTSRTCPPQASSSRNSRAPSAPTLRADSSHADRRL